MIRILLVDDQTIIRQGCADASYGQQFSSISILVTPRKLIGTMVHPLL